MQATTTTVRIDLLSSGHCGVDRLERVVVDLSGALPRAERLRVRRNLVVAQLGQLFGALVRLDRLGAAQALCAGRLLHGGEAQRNGAHLQRERLGLGRLRLQVGGQLLRDVVRVVRNVRQNVGHVFGRCFVHFILYLCKKK